MPRPSTPLRIVNNHMVRFTAVLRAGAERVDEMESAFVVLGSPAEGWTPEIVLRDNYLTIAGRPLFLFGTDSYSNVYRSTHHGPLGWAREHAAARDFGFSIYEILHHSPPGHRMQARDWRSFRAMAELAATGGLVFMPGMLIGHDVAVPEERIEEESRLCREYAEHLGDVPGLIWYINGDYKLRGTPPEAVAAGWNRFLERRYGTTERLRAAWGPEDTGPEDAGAGKLGSLPWPPPDSGRWDSVAQIDRARYQTELVRRWNSAHVAAIRSRETKRPITSEYYSFPFSGIDQRLTIDGQDLSNFGFFDEPGEDFRVLPLRIRWNDLRAEGKSVGLGEYGVKTHPAWAVENGGEHYHIVRSEEEQKRLFLAVAAYALGMGCSRAQNWCLRDADENVFPWGVFYPGVLDGGTLVPKDVAPLHRNLSLLFHLVEPRWEPPALTVLLCDHQRLGSHEALGYLSGERAFDTLLGLHAEFDVLGDTALARIPAATRAIVYPAALALSDESFDALLGWVQRGGQLLLTGAPVFDTDRRLSRAGRLERLTGVRWLGARYEVLERERQNLAALRPEYGVELPALEAAPLGRLKVTGGAVLARTSDGTPALVRHEVDRGVVHYFADPLELAPAAEGSTLQALYGWFLRQAKIPRLQVSPDTADLHVFAQRTRSGRAHVVVNRRRGDGARDRRIDQIDATITTRAGEVKLGVRDGYPAMAFVSDDGHLTAACAWQSASAGGHQVIGADGLVAVASLDGAGLSHSRALLLLPFSEGELRLATARAWRRPVVLLGDIHSGRLRVLERIDPARYAQSGDGGILRVELDADRASLVGLVCEEDKAPRWVDAITALASAPWTVPGR